MEIVLKHHPALPTNLVTDTDYREFSACRLNLEKISQVIGAARPRSRRESRIERGAIAAQSAERAVRDASHFILCFQGFYARSIAMTLAVIASMMRILATRSRAIAR